MKIAVITLFPGMLEALTGFGVSGRAVKQGMVSLEAFNPLSFLHKRSNNLVKARCTMTLPILNDKAHDCLF